MYVFRLAFVPPGHGKRKIILATNIAESSLTIPDVAYVIDFCLTKVLRADPETQYTRLHLEWADRAALTQRTGRAGRVRNGRVFRLIPRRFYFCLPEETEPEMKRTALAKLVLDSKLLGKFGAPKIILGSAMDPPRIKDIKT